MKAMVYPKYGLPDVLEVREIDTPTPKEDEVLVRVAATSVNPADWYGMIGLFIGRLGSGLSKPKDPRLGVDYAGVVEAVGEKVTRFRPGEEVYGGRSGAFAEYVTVRETRGIARKAANLTSEQAAAVPVAGLTALQGLRDHGKLQPGQHVLINGAAGGVGTFAVQIAKALGADVTGVTSTRNVDLVRSLGADHVFDYTREDFTHSGQRYDLLLDVAGSRSWAEYRRVLKPEANYVLVGASKSNRVVGPLATIAKIRLAALRASQKFAFFIAELSQADLETMKDLIEAGQVTPSIDRCYPFVQLPEAMRYLGTGHARGKIVMTMKDNP